MRRKDSFDLEMMQRHERGEKSLPRIPRKFPLSATGEIISCFLISWIFFLSVFPSVILSVVFLCFPMIFSFPPGSFLFHEVLHSSLNYGENLMPQRKAISLGKSWVLLSACIPEATYSIGSRQKRLLEESHSTCFYSSCLSVSPSLSSKKLAHIHITSQLARQPWMDGFG